MFKPSLVHLETLVWIARLGSFAAAAVRLNTTQPTISSRVKELEERLGIEVFEKMGRRMVLTVKGRSLVDRYAPLLDEMENVLLSVTDARAMRGTIRLGCGEIFAVTGLAAIVKHAKEAMPHVDWEIDVDLTVNLKRKLDSAALDLAIIVATPDEYDPQAICLARTQLTWTAHRALARAHRLLNKQAGFAQVPIWTLSKPSFQYQLTMACLPEGKHAYRLNTCNHVKSLIEVIGAGAGVSMLPDSLVEDDKRRRHLVRVLPALDPVPVEFRAARRRDTNDSLLLAAHDLIQRYAAGHRKATSSMTSNR